MKQAQGYAAYEAKGALKPFSFERRETENNDVAIDILYCGVCHSDIHKVLAEWGSGMFPMVPGHEIIGKVSSVGENVTRFAVGDLVGVGCFVDSCRTCSACKDNQEQYCEKGTTWTYAGMDKKHDCVTYGGYSDTIVVDEEFVLRIPEGLVPAAAAPLLCAGITTYSPLRHWNVGPGMKVGIVGLGGLGHMALKFSSSFGAHVVQFTTSEHKKKDALALGANEVVLSTNADDMKKHSGSFDVIIDTVSATHDMDMMLSMLKRDGVMIVVGVPPKPHEISAFSLIGGRKTLAGSLIGGIKETQEMLDYCGKNNIVSEVEIIPIQDINSAYERTIKSDVKYRFVIDMSSLKNA